jgi:hypothetical protein
MLHHSLLHFTIMSSHLAPSAINSPAVKPRPVIVGLHYADVDGGGMQ